MRNSFLKACLFCIILLYEGVADSWAAPLEPGAILPKVVLEHKLSPDMKKYLGLTEKKSFSLNNVAARCLILELFNTYCATCPKDVLKLDEIFASALHDPRLENTMKVVSIAAGNNETEVALYIRKHAARYPIIADPDFYFFKALDNPRVPLTILATKTPRGFKIVQVHRGNIESGEKIMQELLRSSPGCRQ